MDAAKSKASVTRARVALVSRLHKVPMCGPCELHLIPKAKPVVIPALRGLRDGWDDGNYYPVGIPGRL